MNATDLETLVDYHYWARDRLIDALDSLTPDQMTKDLGNSFPSIRDTLCHLIGAERVWCARWKGESPQALPVVTYPDLISIRHAWTEQEQELRTLLQRFAEHGLAETVEYTAFNGQRQSQPFWQMLQHVVNHGSYHRGQVTTMLRQLGVSPAQSMDLIAFYRERANK
jgi:uncharacterized damage-inducible protein DinB